MEYKIEALLILRKKMEEKFKDFVINKLIEEGDINEDSLRDYKIKRRYKILRENGLSAKEAREKLTNEFNRADKTIQKVLYR